MRLASRTFLALFLLGATMRAGADVAFTNVTATALLGIASSPGRGNVPPNFTGGAAVGDCDRDGRPDIYATGLAHDVLYRNRGDNVFYQRPTFVTPAFPGYTSGHSTFSRAAAEVMTRFTGDPLVPGGLGELHAAADDFLLNERGPSVDVLMQWATYNDAADLAGQSRLAGGIHVQADDFNGRITGSQVGITAFDRAMEFLTGAAARDR